MKFYQTCTDLSQQFRLSESEQKQLNEICMRYPMRTNSYYLSLVDPDDPADPIRKMSIPSAWELDEGGHDDTSGEEHNTVLDGLQHKYQRTALLLFSSECYMYCRHCFRKRMVGITDAETNKQLEQTMDYLRSHPEIDNVLVSGGDALCCSNEKLERCLELFSSLPQLRFIRIGTRVPVVLPQRIYEDTELLDMLQKYNSKKQIYIVTQFNHPRELTSEAIRGIKALLSRGIVIRNQTVLLKGVNDDGQVLGQLLMNLTAAGVLPYYVFQCRPVRGVLNHFQVPLQQGCDIVNAARTLVNGQAKAFRYVMSHETGKIEILGKLPDNTMLFKYHQSKYEADENRIFTRKLAADACWLPE